MKKSLISSHSAYHRPRDKLVTYYLQWYGFGRGKITGKHSEISKQRRGHSLAGYISTMIRMSRKY